VSKESCELVRAVTEAWRRREQEATFEFVAEDVVWDATALAALIPDLAGVYRGHDGIRSYWRRWLAAWRDLQFEIEDVRNAGDDAVLLIRNQRQWGRHSGIELSIPPYGAVFTVRAGKIARVRWFADQDSALRAASLEATDRHPEAGD
jgi:ketosteroid isomerase-like protein